MRRLSPESGHLAQTASVLLICVVIALSANTGFAQRKRPPRKPATRTQSDNLSAGTNRREPEVQLESLPPDRSVDDADIAITAHVRASSLRFETVPNPTVEFPGQPQRETVWDAQRENLPTPVQPGVTYRNIGIRLKITSIFSDIDRIVAEALGEIPVTDDNTAALGTNKSSSPNAKSPGSQPISSRPVSVGRQ